MIWGLFTRVSLFFHTKKARAVMEDAFRSLEPVARECGALDGLRGIPDRFSEMSEARLRNASLQFLDFSPKPEALAEREEKLEAYRRDADDKASVCRERTRKIASAAQAVGGAWVAPVSIVLLALLSGLVLAAAGAKLDPTRIGVLVCAAALIGLNYKRIPAWLAEDRAIRLVERLDRMIVANRLRVLAETERHSRAERWIVERQRELGDLYRLHRSRAEKAAELAAREDGPGCISGAAPLESGV